MIAFHTYFSCYIFPGKFVKKNGAQGTMCECPLSPPPPLRLQWSKKAPVDAVRVSLEEKRVRVFALALTLTLTLFSVPPTDKSCNLMIRF